MSIYGSVFKWFFAIVAETGTDQSGLDRVKVRVDGVHGSEITNNDLPYAQCILPNTSGGTSGIGENPRLESGARVVGFFADGELCQLPIVIGPVPHIGLPSETQRVNQQGSSEALLTSIRPQTRSFIRDFIPQKTPTGETATNPHIAWHFFSMTPGLNYEYKPHHIAGMIGNFTIEGRNFVKDETTGKTKKIEMDPEARGDKKAGTIDEYTAYGIAQWGLDRQKELRNYAAREDIPINDIITQLKFVDWELKNYEFLRKNFFQTENVEEATMMFMRVYERPQILKETTSRFVNTGKFGKPAGYWNIRSLEEERIKEARAAYNLFTQYYPES